MDGSVNFAAGDEVTIPWPFQLLLSQLELDDDGSDVDIVGVVMTLLQCNGMPRTGRAATFVQIVID